MRTPLPTRFAAVLVAVAVPSCAQLIGLDQFHDGICEPGTTTSEGCPYSGAEGTQDVGVCKAGVRTCKEDGTGWGTCKGEVTPKDEDCSTPLDENCDGHFNEKESGCCSPSESFSCYDGPDVNRGVGACVEGAQTCGEDGKTVSACVGAVKPSQERCDKPEDENCDGYDCVEWAQLLGDTADQHAMATVVDGAGNIVIVGVFSGTIPLGSFSITTAGTDDAFVIKIAPDGKPLWGVAIGDVGKQTAWSVGVDSTGDVVAGLATAQPLVFGGKTLPAGSFLTKLSAADGHLIWAKGLGGNCTGVNDAAVAAISFTTQNDIAIAGGFCGSVDFGDGAVLSSGGSRDAFAALLRGADGSGRKADGYWAVTFGDSADQLATGIVSSDLGFDVLGTFSGQISFGTGWTANSQGDQDVFLARLSTDAKPLRLVSYGDADTQTAGGIRRLPDGGYVFAGSFQGTIDFSGTKATSDTNANGTFVVKFGHDDKVKWLKAIPGDPVGPTLAIPTGLAVDDAGDVAVTGLYAGAPNFGTGPLTSTADLALFLVKFDSAGNTLWSRAINAGSGAPYPASMTAMTGAGEVILAGYVGHPVDFGTGTLTPAGGADAFVAKFGL